MAGPTSAIDTIPVDPMVHTPAQNFLYALLKQDVGADVEARSNMNVDGSGTPVSFYYEVPEGIRFEFERFNMYMLDMAMTRHDSFGAVSGPLSPGVGLRILDTSKNVKLDFTDGLNIRQNADWILLAGVDEFSSAAAGPDEVASRFTVGKAGDQMTLFGGERIECLIQNDLTGLNEFRIQVQGILLPREASDPQR